MNINLIPPPVKPTILLAEDNSIVRDVMVALLTDRGLAVDTVENGFLAVEIARTKTYNLILMDIQMPEMDGLQATRIIRSTTTTAANNRNTPILALTATDLEGDLQACLDAGMNDCVTKPVEPDHFFSIINRWLRPNEPVNTEDVQRSEPRQAQTGTTDNDVLYAQLSKIEGIDTRTGLNNLAGDMAGYLSLLSQFDDMLIGDMSQLTSLIGSGEKDQACRLTHTFKGVAGTLGLVGLQDSTLALEACLRNRDGKCHDRKEATLLLQQLKSQVENLHDVLLGVCSFS